jgi:hypothetical protein
MYIGLHVKYPFLLLDFKENCIFSTDFQKILKYQISRKSVQWEPSCSMRTETDTTKLIVAFRNFAKQPKYEDDVRSSSGRTLYEVSWKSVNCFKIWIWRHYLCQLSPPTPRQDKAADFSHQCRYDVKITCCCIWTPYAVLMWCLVELSDNFTFRISYTFQIPNYIVD